MGVRAALTADLQDLTVFETRTGTNVISNEQARTGTYSYKVTSGTLQKNIPASDTLYVRFALFLVGSTQICIVRFRESTTQHVALHFDTNTNQNNIYFAYPGKTLYIPVRRLLASIWLDVECYIKIHDTLGEFTLKVWGDTIYTATGLDTRNGGTGVVDNIVFAFNAGTSFYLDDVVIRDDKWPGRGGLYLRVPTADGASHNDWTASAGDRWECVDDNPPNDYTDYIHTSADDQRQLFTSGALSGVHYQDASFVGVLAKGKVDGYTSASVNGFLRSNVTVDDDAAVTVATADKWVGGYSEDDPNGGGDWDAAAVDAVQFGIKSVSITP